MVQGRQFTHVEHNAVTAQALPPARKLLLLLLPVLTLLRLPLARCPQFSRAHITPAQRAVGVPAQHLQEHKTQAHQITRQASAWHEVDHIRPFVILTDSAVSQRRLITPHDTPHPSPLTTNVQPSCTKCATLLSSIPLPKTSLDTPPPPPQSPSNPLPYPQDALLAKSVLARTLIQLLSSPISYNTVSHPPLQAQWWHAVGDVI
jgi:hypothetical protein